MKKCLITGAVGQDGAYLAKLLLAKGCEVWGAYRRSGQDYFWRVDALGIRNQIQWIPIELLELSNILRVLEKSQPDEVYHLAAQSYVAVSFEEPIYTADVTALGTVRMLEGIRTVNPKIKFYQASSSEMFGAAQETPQKETTPFYPRSPYAAAKLHAHWATINHRESYGMFAVSGICFNHESPLRGLDFVTRRITNGAARIKNGLASELRLGNLQARRDWGYAGDYVEAMWLMLQQKEPQDYVIATGEQHSVADFAQTAFQAAGLNWKDYVKVDSALLRSADVEALIGDASKAKRQLGWKPKVDFSGLVSMMVKADMEYVTRQKPLAAKL